MCVRAGWHCQCSACLLQGFQTDSIFARFPRYHLNSFILIAIDNHMVTARGISQEEIVALL